MVKHDTTLILVHLLSGTRSHLVDNNHDLLKVLALYDSANIPFEIIRVTD